MGLFLMASNPIIPGSNNDRTGTMPILCRAMREAFAAGVQGLFEPDELRRVVGFEPLQNDVMPTEGDAPNDA